MCILYITLTILIERDSTVLSNHLIIVTPKLFNTDVTLTQTTGDEQLAVGHDFTVTFLIAVSPPVLYTGIYHQLTTQINQ